MSIQVGYCGIKLSIPDYNSKPYSRYFCSNVLCGTLQCAKGSQQPHKHLNRDYTRTIISNKGQEFECK